jgi:hypothetical protein
MRSRVRRTVLEWNLGKFAVDFGVVRGDFEMLEGDLEEI